MPIPHMKFQFGKLILAYFIFSFIDSGFGGLIEGSMTEWFNDFESLQSTLLFGSSYLSFFLYSFIAYLTLYWFFPKKRWLYLAIGVGVSIVLPIAVRYALEQKVYDWLFDFTNYRRDVQLSYYFEDNLFYATKHVGFGAVYYLVRTSFFREKRERELAEAHQKMELSLLRSQINPHFLLNAMNNIYSLVYHQSEHALEALDTLSGLLKYSLYEVKERVTVSREMEHVNQLIALNRLRFDFPVHVQVSVSPEVHHTQVPPFLMMPLIENGFKHGDLSDESAPLRLDVSKTEGRLSIAVQNRKAQAQKDEQGGIGLDNIRKRLQLTFPTEHTFDIHDRHDTFEVRMTIPAP